MVETLRFCLLKRRPFPPNDAHRPNAHYDSRLRDPGFVHISMFSDRRTLGIGGFAVGDVEVSNLDGAYNHVYDWGFDGRDIRIYIGEGDVFADYSLWYNGSQSAPEFIAEEDGSYIRFTIRNPLEFLDAPVQQARYAGDNVAGVGLEGSASDIGGQYKPLAFGYIAHARAVLVNSTTLVFQLHDGAIQSVITVWDSGVVLELDSNVGTGGDVADIAALQAAVIEPGKFITCLAYGVFRLGASPAGEITARFEGDNTNGYVEDAGSIIERIALRTGYTTSQLVSADFSAFKTANPHKTGILFENGESAREAIAELLLPSHGFFNPYPNGTLGIGNITLPSRQPDVTLAAEGNLSFGFGQPGDTDDGIPPYEVELSYNKNYYVQTADNLAAGVSDTDKAYFAEAYRKVVSTHNATKDKHLLSRPLVLNCLLAEQSDAQTAAQNLLDFYAPGRTLLTIRAATPSTPVQLNQVVQVSYRINPSIEGLYTVIGKQEEPGGNTMEFTLLH
jgi:hypothetical protein